MDDAARDSAEDLLVPDLTRRFARYVAGYRGNLSRQEAARRAGLPEVLWERIESAERPGPEAEQVPAAIVAAMCAAVRADVARGLELAGYPPDSYPHLVDRPSVFSSLARRTHAIAGPFIATPHVVTAAIDSDPVGAPQRMAAVYRQLAESNHQVADLIAENPPDARSEYWSGYAAAVRAVAEQQELAADPELGS